MSTKTNFKRVALVAVAALGLGVLTSVAPASAVETAGQISSVTGVGVLKSDVSDQFAATATVLSTGTIVLVNADAAAIYKITSGSALITGTFTGGVLATPDNDLINADAQSVTLTDDDTVHIRPTGGAGSTIVIKGYDGTTLASRLTVTVAGSSVAGVASAAMSEIQWVTDGTSAPDAAGKDDTGASTTVVNGSLFMNVNILDAYENPITVPGALVVTASKGAVTKIAAAGVHTDPAGPGVTGTAVSAVLPVDLNVEISEETPGTGWTGSVTVTFNGVLIATKSGTITGAPASIVVTPKKVGQIAASAASFTFVVKDAAGNALDTTASDWSLISSSGGLVTTAVGVGNDATVDNGYTETGTITCAAAGSTDVVIGDYVAGELVKSNSFKMLCGGAAATYTASFDKAVYAQGDVATLTVAFKDAKGNAANSFVSVTGVAADQVITHPMMELIGAYTAAQKVGVAGTVTYKYTVGTTTFAPGKFNTTVTFPTVTTGSIQTVGYEVTSVVGGVSNADVLKAIVSLIASINKQIAALQKALLKKK